MKRVALSIVVVLGWAVPGFAQRPIQVAGIVRSATTGEGLRSAAVILSAHDLSSHDADQKSSRATTGADGSFSFSGLPPGQYQLTVRKSGYQTFSGNASVTILRDSAETTRLAPSLWPHGAIAGCIVDWDGEPVAQAEVRAYAVVYQTTGATLSLAAKEESNDIGEYRLFDLPAGEYVLQVSPPRTGTPSGHFYADAPTVYYPSAPAPAQALPVKLKWGQEVMGADVKMTRGQSYAIAGLVWDAWAEGPCTHCQVQAMQQDGRYSISLPQTVRVSREGAFVLRGLSSGDYNIVVRQASTKDAVAEAQIGIRDRHVEDVRLIVGLQQPVTGQIVLENPPEGIGATDWLPHLSPVALPEWWPGAEGRVRADRQFTVPGVSPARYRFELGGLPPGAYLKTLRLAGQPLANSEIVVSQQAPLSGLEAVIAFDGATVHGKVPSTAGPARVLLMSSRAGTLPPQISETGSDSSFSFGSVPPGSYMLYAVPATAAVQLFDPALQPALAQYGKQVDLAPGATVTVEAPLAREMR